MTHYNHLAVAQEAISFQGNGFFQELLLVINMFKREERTNAYTKQWDEFAENINKCIKKRTGLNCKIKFTRQEYAAILVPLIDYHNVVMSHVLDGAGADADQLKALEKAGGMLKASIDLKNSKVSGALADREAVIMINPLIFTTNIDGLELTDEEIAAVILHEVGHFFTGLEFMDRMVTTNQILAEMARNLNREKEPSKREIIVKKASKELDIDRNQLQDIDLENGKVVTEYMLGVGLKKLRHQNGHSFYDMNTWEMAADQFAVRHGAGAAMASVADKLARAYPDSSVRSSGEFIFEQIKSVGYGLSAIVFAIGAWPVSPLITILFVLIGSVNLFDDHTSRSEPTYDNARGRLVRIRNTYVAAIKEFMTGGQKGRFTTEYIRTLTNDVKAMDKLIEGSADKTSFVGKVKAFLFSSEANRQASVAFQKELEAIAHNDLYAAALALKTI